MTLYSSDIRFLVLSSKQCIEVYIITLSSWSSAELRLPLSLLGAEGSIGQARQISRRAWLCSPRPWPTGLAQRSRQKLLTAAKPVATVSWRGILSSQQSISHLAFYGIGFGEGLATRQKRVAEWRNHVSPQRGDSDDGGNGDRLSCQPACAWLHAPVKNSDGSEISLYL